MAHSLQANWDRSFESRPGHEYLLCVAQKYVEYIWQTLYEAVLLSRLSVECFNRTRQFFREPNKKSQD
jgi:hypothetical protein